MRKTCKIMVTGLTALALTASFAMAVTKDATPVGNQVIEQSAATPVAAKQQTVQLSVTGMTWGVGCVKKVRSALSKIKGVTKAVVSMPNKAVVTVAANVTDKQLEAAVKAAGGRYAGKVVSRK